MDLVTPFFIFHYVCKKESLKCGVKPMPRLFDATASHMVIATVRGNP